MCVVWLFLLRCVHEDVSVILNKCKITTHLTAPLTVTLLEFHRDGWSEKPIDCCTFIGGEFRNTVS